MAIFGKKTSFRIISLNVVLGSSYFCILKLCFGSIYEIAQLKFWEKSRFGRFGPFWVKNTLHVL